MEDPSAFVYLGQRGAYNVLLTRGAWRFTPEKPISHQLLFPLSLPEVREYKKELTMC